ncbi:copper homeostasis protein CutC [Rhizobium tumorigenes]|uniref:PF03932 family protein CutC n=1 Tax=Rhizobium tumorigenes TaxID=2041385 RepID=A0AAF1KRL9_9HYPH|nr:copper homeostasis protein CutC [Rhizobium tumorigenes]WFR94675.1 copper homeostasis protein CutC [Rhizobium tumorigenes]
MSRIAAMLLEVCIEDSAGLAAAIDGGADRIELCSALAIGGLTPSAGLMREAGQRQLPCYAMIRPRAGNFVWSPEDMEVMYGDIDIARSAGLAGVVLGASLPDGRLDRESLDKLVHHARDLGLTLHRAFDLVPDWRDAIEIAVDLGFERILTSGGKVTAPDGIEELETLVELAAGRISIMPGSGINPQTVSTLIPRLKITDIHASCSSSTASSDPRLVSLGFAPALERRTDGAVVRALKALVA